MECVRTHHVWTLSPLYAPIYFCHESTLPLPAYVLYGWPQSQLGLNCFLWHYTEIVDLIYHMGTIYHLSLEWIMWSVPVPLCLVSIIWNFKEEEKPWTLTLPVPCIQKDIKIKINFNFFFTLLGGASKGFNKTCKAFIKHF